MARPLQNEDDVLAAVRRFLYAALRQNEVAEAMASLAVETAGLSLTNLDAWERKIREELWAIKETSANVRWVFWKKPAHFSWLDLCSGSGFTREKTLRALSDGAPNGFFCCLAARRLNDWVPQVRAAARESLPSIAKRSDPEFVVDALWNVLPHWSSWGRTEDADRQVFTDLISIHHVALALKSRLMAATAGPATTILAQAGRTPVLDQWLPEIAKTAVQPSVRAKAYRCQLESRMVWVTGRKWTWADKKWCKARFQPVLEERPLSAGGPFLETLRKAMEDRSSMVRRVAGELLIKHLDSVGAESFTCAEQLASDPSPCVAERGRFALTKLTGHA